MPSTIKIKLETTRILEIIVNSIASDLYFKIDFVDIKFTIDNINPAPLKIKHINPSNSNNNSQSQSQFDISKLSLGYDIISDNNKVNIRNAIINIIENKLTNKIRSLG